METIEIIIPKRRNMFGEYVVKVHFDGKRNPNCDYHTDCRTDAVGTACNMSARYVAKGHKVRITQ
jgi:hypothetical protein